MGWPYVAKDDENNPKSGWYGDVEGVISAVFPSQVEAMQWAIDRLASELGAARHGCRMLTPFCMLHRRTFSDPEYAEMRRQLIWAGVDCPKSTPNGRVLRQYEANYLKEIGRAVRA